MTKRRIMLTCLVLIAALGVGYAFTVTDSAAEETTALHLMVVKDGEFTEVSYELTLDELQAYFDGATLAILLEGDNVLLNSASELDAAAAFVDVEGADEVIANFGTLAITWGCLKCCYDPNCANCCDPPKDPPDPKDPDGD